MMRAAIRESQWRSGMTRPVPQGLACRMEGLS
jgi:hypothetical protein